MFHQVTRICGQSMRWATAVAIAFAVSQVEIKAQQPLLPRARKAEKAPPRVIVEQPRAVVAQPAVVAPAAPAVVAPAAPAPAVRAVRPGVVVRREFRPTEIRAADVGIWFDRAAKDSLLIADIAPDSAVARLGFIEGDRILAVNGVKVNNEPDFIKLVFAAERRAQPVEVLVVRKNKEQVILVDPAVLQNEYLVVRQDPTERFGLVVDDRYDDRIVVWKVIPRSPAFYAGLRSGDVITKFRGQPIAARKAFVESFTTLEPGPVAVEVRRGERVRPLEVDLPREWNVSSIDERSDDRRQDSRDARIDERSERRDAVREDRREGARDDRRTETRERDSAREDRREEKREVRTDDRREEKREDRASERRAEKRDDPGQDRLEDKREERRVKKDEGR